MFIVRSEKGQGLLDWNTAKQIPWGVLLMFAAGITIAKAFFESGLADLIGASLSDAMSGMPLLLIVFLVCLSITFFTECNSNLATTTLILPVLATAASHNNMAPELLMIPATISASCAFMRAATQPIDCIALVETATPSAPNAIAYATDKISVKHMMREGFALNLLFAFPISGLCYLLI